MVKKAFQNKLSNVYGLLCIKNEARKWSDELSDWFIFHTSLGPSIKKKRKKKAFVNTKV